MKKVTAVLIGAGGRGMDSYAPYALNHPDEIQFVAVAEPDPLRRQRFQDAHKISADRAFSGFQELFSAPKLADAALICTQDRLHFEPTMRALDLGYHVLLEKPMAPTPGECVQMAQQAEKQQRLLEICHVLRYTEFFQALKELLEEGKIGDLVSIQHSENVGFWHQALSFVRGPWNNSEESNPMIVAKCCHDMDLLVWLVGADCTYLASFGSLSHFKKENVPTGAPEYCQDGCSHEVECPYFAPRYYFEGWTKQFASWAVGAADDMPMEEKLRRLRASSHGRCVYQSNNNVVDHQVVSLEFANGVTVAFSMCAFTNQVKRTIKLMGTKGEIRGDMEKNEIEVTTFLSQKIETIRLLPPSAGHGGGDTTIMRDFIRAVQSGNSLEGQTSARVSVQSHLMAFAAEKARLEKKVIDLAAYRRTFEHLSG